jgi:transposase
MSYSGLVSSEYSSGNRIQRGGITKNGNAHLRRVMVEAAWA